jgi:hypothetical protein
MSYRETEIARQTDIRRRLLANGYSPVPNYDKRCFMVGRNDVVVDGALIDVWSTQLKNLSTGVRVQWPLVAIDIDVDDVPALEAIVDALPEELWDKVRHAPVRRSSSRTKEAWFVRLDEGCDPFSRLTSASFFHPEDPDGEDGTTHRVEIFGPESGQQMGVFGAHTRDDSDVTVVHKDYVWDGPSLLDVAIWDLPVLTRAEVAAIADTATRVLTDIGWGRKLRSKSGFSSPQTLFDLGEDKAFEITGGETLSLGELLDVARGERGVRLAASFHSPGSHNTSRCVANYGSDGVFRIIDFETGNTHRIASEAPKPVTMGALDRLQALAAGGTIFDRGGASASEPVADAPVGVQMADDMGAVVDAMVEEYCYMTSEQRCVVPLSSPTEGAMTLGNFRTLMQPHAVTVTGPRGGEQTIHPVPLWAGHARRIDVDGYRYRPDIRAPLAPLDGRLFVNTYRAPEDVACADAAGAVAAFEALIAHLLPINAERDWFRMWVAAKAQRPWVIGCGVLMVASIQGTGRGTLFDMLGAVFGPRNVSPVSSVELLGGGGQGQYNGWLSDSVLVTCDEVMAGDDGGGSMTWKRRESYERLKQYTDPRRREVLIRKKNVNAYTAEIFASMLLATNHLNALPLTVDDRRFAVLMQEDIKFIDRRGLADVVNPWRPDGVFGAGFGTALRDYLCGIAVDWATVREAPNLGDGRLIMQQQNEGDVEDILRDVLSRVPGDFIASEDLRRRTQLAVTAYGEGDHLKNWWRRAQDILRAESSMGWRAMPTRQTVVGADGRQKLLTVYHRAAGGVRDAWVETPIAGRAALLAPAADVNRALTALEHAQREGHISLVSG